MTLYEKGLYSEMFWSVSFGIRGEYGEIFHISPYTVRMWKNMDQKISEYGHFSRNVIQKFCRLGIQNF